jgi:hypothetical protein
MLQVTLDLGIRTAEGDRPIAESSRRVTLLPVLIQGKEYLGGVVEEGFPIPDARVDYVVKHEGKYLLDVDLKLEKGLVFSSHSNPIRIVDRAKAFANDRK